MEAMNFSGDDPNVWKNSLHQADVEDFLKERNGIVPENHKRPERVESEAYADVPKELISNPKISEIGLVFYDEISILDDGAEVSQRKVRLEVTYVDPADSQESYTLTIPDQLARVPSEVITAIAGDLELAEARKQFLPIRDFIVKIDTQQNRRLN